MAGPGVRRTEAAPDADDGDAWHAPPAGSITLPGVERSVSGCRRFVRETLGSRHPALEPVALSVSELATNAIMHTSSGDGGQITVVLIATTDVVRAEVTNDGTMATKPRVRRDPQGENGRGILIVDTLADAWGVIERSGTTIVWVEFHRPSR